MEAKDLRIDNWVHYEGTTKGNIQMSSQDIYDLDRKEFDLMGVEIFGIPLTEDWLRRFGFKHSKTLGGWMNGSFATCRPGDYEDALYHHFAMFWFNDGFCIEVTNEHGESATLSMPKVKYVHQLQNLYFALTGEELTLTT